uniref:Allergen Hum j 3 n=1 Tax=Humulus japonicus TaxID=3485 RepID=ALL3_HUMJA|nr:RecName: Full=Allergen Hum j 3; AltName: Allergen=Hum j 3 [Humulus japonicus]ADB97919.1 Hum s 3 allergen [Humulus scandens]
MDNPFENGMKACTSLYDKYYQNCVMKLPPGACIDSENYRKCLTNHIGSCDIDTCFEDVSIACRSIYPSNYAECATTHHNICGDLQG